MSSFSIGQNIGKSNMFSSSTGSSSTGSSSTGSSSNTGGGGSFWNTLFSDTLPALFQYGGATLASTRQSKAQEEIAKNQSSIMSWFNGQSGVGMQGMQPRNNNIIWIILALVAVVVLFFIFKKK